MNSKESFMALVPDNGCEYENQIGSEYSKVLCTPFKKSAYKYSNQSVFDDFEFSRKIKAVQDDTDATFKKNNHGAVVFQSVESQIRNVRSRTLSTIEQTSRRFLEQDEIIQQKDIMISSLRKIIEEQRQRNSILEDKLLRKDQFYSNTRNNLLEEEYQNQIQRLKYDLHQLNSKTNGEMEKLQRKLGEKEYESVKLTIALKENNLKKETMIENLKKELESTFQNLSSKDELNTQLKTETGFLKQEIGKLESYLESIPTSEEFIRMKNNMRSVIDERDQLLKQKENLCGNYKDSKRELFHKKSQLEKTNKKISEFKDQIDMLKRTIEKYDNRGPISIDEHEEHLNNLLITQKENEDLKQNLSKCQKKLTRFQYEFVAKRKENESEKQQLSQDIEVLRQNLKDKCNSVTQIQTRNQEVLREKLEIEVKLNKLESKYDDKIEQVLLTVYTATLSCFDEVKNFVSLCTTMSEGEEPDLQLLLGLRDSPEKENKLRQEIDVKELEKRLEEIGNVKSELERLRRIIAEKHAEEIGKNMCITQ